jgi:hypothetical protein
MTWFLRYLELHLTGAGLIVIFAAAAVANRFNVDLWQVTGCTATAVGAIHGMIFWFVRRRQRQVRQVAIDDVRSMLKDVVKTQLAVLQLAHELNHLQPGRITPEAFDRSIARIASAVDSLSNESLKTWQQRYNRT